MGLEEGARQVIDTCMKISREDRLVIISDEHTLDIASSIITAAKKRTKTVDLFILEDFGERPIKDLPKEIASSLGKATASVFAGESREGEIESVRRPVLKIVTDRQIRHAHMVGVTREIMEQGMAADYTLLQAFSAKVHGVLKHAAQIRVIAPGGTDFTAQFSSKIPWIISDGNVRKEKWSNLPDGEVWTCVDTCHGRFVIDGVLGDYFSKRYGLLEDNPVTLHIANARVKSVECALASLKADFEKLIATDENSNRVGEFALGTNLALTKLIGNLLQDEKFPGVHIAVGHCYPYRTGVSWDSKVHCDAVIKEPTVIVDGRKVMEAGKYLI
jgi:aminopeptidase